MRGMKRLTLTVALVAGIGIAPLIGQNASLQTVPLSADIDVVNVRTLSDGNTLRHETKMKFYRRADGSTRVEEPNRVVIVDNGSHTVTVLNMTSKVAQVQDTPASSANGPTPVAKLSQVQARGTSLVQTNGSPKADLGVKVIGGYSVRGVQRSTTIPANSALGNTAPITKTMQVWRSSDLRLPLLTVISDPLGGTTTSQYENISTAVPPESSLFTIPPGYTVVHGQQSRVIDSHTN